MADESVTDDPPTHGDAELSAAEAAEAAAVEAAAAARVAETLVGEADIAAQDAAGSHVAAKEAAQEAMAAATLSARAAAIAADHEQRHEERQLLAELGVDVDSPEVESEIYRLQAGASAVLPFGRPGRPLSVDSPFRLGFVGALGVAASLLMVRTVLAAAPILLLIGIALFIAIGLDPAVTWLQGRGLRRPWAVFVIVAGVLAACGLFLAVAVPPLIAQASGLRTGLPDYLERLEQDNDIVGQLDERFNVVERVRTTLSTGPVVGGSGLNDVVGVAMGVFSALASTLTVLVLSLYILASLPTIKRTSYRLVPRTRRARFSLLADDMLDRIGAYLLGNLVTSVVAGVAAYLFFSVAGVPYPLPLAVFVALADLIPLVGATIGAVASVVIAFSVSVPVGLATLAFSFVYQQFENFVLAPHVMKRTVDVTPLTTIVAALIGATLLGVFGALLAVPVAASIQIVGRHVVLPRQEST